MKAHILILEDDLSLRELLADNLEDYDYQVSQSASGEEALARVNRGGLDLIVTDVRMAGMDGLETLTRILEIAPDLKSIVITGFADESAPPRAVAAQAWDYLYKPFSLEELLSAVRRVLGAQEERGRYQRLLSGVLGKLSDAQLSWLEKDRDRAFRAYYLSVRADRISEAAAVEIWSHLVRLEAERDKLQAGVDLGLSQRLAEGYRSVPAGLSTLEKLPLHHAPAPPLANLRLQPLLRGIKAGRVSSEQLKLAPLLNGPHHQTLRRAPELEALYEALWGKA